MDVFLLPISFKIGQNYPLPRMLVHMDKPEELNSSVDFVVIISANAEWKEVKKQFPRCDLHISPYGEWFGINYPSVPRLNKPVIFIHGGWGKVAAAGSAQYAIDAWHPHLMVNLGTCGGFEGDIERGQIVLVEKTIIYDIFEQMGDPVEHIQHYMTEIDNSWVSGPLPLEVVRTILVSGDRDLFWKDMAALKSKYGATAGDWESGPIAWIASKNHTPCFILRGVTDLVGESGGEAYEGKVDYFYENTALVMKTLIEALPQWLIRYSENYSKKMSK
jgi:adenosylhomocysteine nucleosidase